MSHPGGLQRAAVLLSCVCLLAAGPKIIEMNAPAPKAVVKQYFAAVNNNDVAGAKANSAGDPGNQLAAVMMTRVTHSTRRVMTACADRFGETGTVNDMPFNLRYPDMSAFDKAAGTITGETATVTIPMPNGQPPSRVPLRRINGLWKVDLNATLRLPADRPEYVHGVNRILDAMDGEARNVAAEITAGKFANWSDAVTAGTTRMHAAALKKVEEIGEERRKAGAR